MTAELLSRLENATEGLWDTATWNGVESVTEVDGQALDALRAVIEDVLSEAYPAS